MYSAPLNISGKKMWTVLVRLRCSSAWSGYSWCRCLRSRDTNCGLFCLSTTVTLYVIVLCLKCANSK